MPSKRKFAHCARAVLWLALGSALQRGEAAVPPAAQDGIGSIRGVVSDRDFEIPLSGVEVRVLELPTLAAVQSSDQGNWVLTPVPPGKYTLAFSKAGYQRQLRSDVVVTAGELSEVDVYLSAEYSDMEEFVVQDILQSSSGSEEGLLNLRLESPSLLDSIGSDLMSRAGASDAASALRLVSGATVSDGKFAVVRGLPDRYVSSQMNQVRLPSADEDKRAVELDQFPSAVLDSIQVSKTFTPDQQGDASGGAVDVRLKGIPDENTLQFQAQTSFNTQATGRSDFLSYDGGGLDFWGQDDGGRDIQYDLLGQPWNGAVGVSEIDAPIDQKYLLSGGGKKVLDSGISIGGFASIFYERDSSFYDNGIDDSYWVVDPGAGLTPQSKQGTPSQGDFKTALFDVTQSEKTVRWGGLATVGVESENHSLKFTTLYTRTAGDKATLATDTRGKEYYFPGYDRDDPMAAGNFDNQVSIAPYLRTETLEYTERTTGTFQLNGTHKLPFEGFGSERFLMFKKPELDWVLSTSFADQDQPDKRQFGAYWLPDSYKPGAPPFIDPFVQPNAWYPYKPGANFTLGNLQRIWKEISEDSNQYSVNLKLPFEQWAKHEGYLKFGVFDDDLGRDFNQDTYSNFNDTSPAFEGGWDDPWSAQFPFEDTHPITAANVDVDYKGSLDVNAYYGMFDLPLTSSLDVIAGARFESTKIGIVNDPEPDAVWFPKGATAPVALNPGDADVQFDSDDVLPSVALAYEPTEQITVRAGYAETIARQTFKELTPIIQQEFLGGPIFIGNPELSLSSLKNVDLRVDYRPYQGGLLSASAFRKDIEDPIEYVQRVTVINFTEPVNYPKGHLQGIELEARQDLARLLGSRLEGLSIGANATWIDSEVTLPDDEAAIFSGPAIQAPMPTRDMTNAPNHLYNLFVSYELPQTGTQLTLAYTVTGESLVAGAGQDQGNFVPNVYARQYDTLNLSLTQNLGEHFKLQFQAKNLTNPYIEQVYRSDVIGDDVIRTSYTKGAEFSIALTARFSH